MYGFGQGWAAFNALKQQIKFEKEANQFILKIKASRLPVFPVRVRYKNGPYVKTFNNGDGNAANQRKELSP